VASTAIAAGFWAVTVKVALKLQLRSWIMSDSGAFTSLALLVPTQTQSKAMDQ